MIKDHPAIGQSIHYEDGKRSVTGKVTGVKYGGIIVNIKTKENRGRSVKLRIKPDDGSRAFWTIAMRDLSEQTKYRPTAQRLK